MAPPRLAHWTRQRCVAAQGREAAGGEWAATAGSLSPTAAGHRRRHVTHVDWAEGDGRGSCGVLGSVTQGRPSWRRETPRRGQGGRHLSLGRNCRGTGGRGASCSGGISASTITVTCGGRRGRDEGRRSDCRAAAVTPAEGIRGAREGKGNRCGSPSGGWRGQGTGSVASAVGLRDAGLCLCVGQGCESGQLLPGEDGPPLGRSVTGGLCREHRSTQGRQIGHR